MAMLTRILVFAAVVIAAECHLGMMNMWNPMWIRYNMYRLMGMGGMGGMGMGGMGMGMMGFKEGDEIQPDALPPKVLQSLKEGRVPEGWEPVPEGWVPPRTGGGPSNIGGGPGNRNTLGNLGGGIREPNRGPIENFGRIFQV